MVVVTSKKEKKNPHVLKQIIRQEEIQTRRNVKGKEEKKGRAERPRDSKTVSVAGKNKKELRRDP